jgi:hypothetical protein
MLSFGAPFRRRDHAGRHARVAWTNAATLRAARRTVFVEIPTRRPVM